MQTSHFLNSISIDLIGDDYAIRHTDTDKLFRLPKSIIVPDHSHAMVAVRSFNMINSTYLIQTGVNDSLTIETITTNGTAEVTYTIEAGNYTITELVASLNSKISTLISSLNIDSLAFTINGTTHVLDYTATYSTYTLSQISFSTTAYIQLGLQNGITSVYATASGSFPKIFNCQGNNSYYIRIPNLQMSNQNTKNVSNVIANIPVVSGFGDMIYYEIASEPIYHRLEMPEIQELHVQILDEDMNPLGDLLSQSTFRLSLLIHFKYDHFMQKNLIIKNKLFPGYNIFDNKKQIKHADETRTTYQQGSEKSGPQTQERDKKSGSSGRETDQKDGESGKEA
jgi:hypothetical protein